MPTRKIKSLQETTYKIIPAIPSYLISNLGRVYKKSTWKEIAIIDNIVRVTINKKQTGLSVSKLMRELFPTVTAKEVTSINVPQPYPNGEYSFDLDKVDTRTTIRREISKPFTVKNNTSLSKEALTNAPKEETNTNKSNWRDKLIINPPKRVLTFTPEEDIELLKVINFHAEKELHKQFTTLEEVPQEIISMYR